MNRGATAYLTRGQPLALPRGTLAQPALRVGRQRAGLFRSPAGGLGLGIDKFHVVQWTQASTLIRTNVAGTAAPLQLERTVATSADNQETSVEIYEVGAFRGRLALYRQASGKYGWKLYGSTAGAASPDATLDGDGSLTVRSDLISTRDVWSKRDLTVDRDAVIKGNLTATIGVVNVRSLSVGAAGITNGGPLQLNGYINGGVAGQGALALNALTATTSITTVALTASGAVSLPARSLNASVLADGSVTATQIGTGQVGTSEIAQRAVGTQQIEYNAIHQNVAVLGGPPSDQQFAAGAWTPIASLTTTFNPTNTYMFMACAQLSVAHSAGGRVQVRVVDMEGATLRQAGHGPLWGGGEPGGTTWPAPSWFGAMVFWIFNGGSWLTSTFRVEAYSPDPGTVRVLANGSNFQIWSLKR